MSTDRIEKTVFLRAPRSRVWRAIATPEEFGAWFGVNLEGAFAPGKQVSGRITIKGYENVPMEITIDRVEPERLISFRWHPFAVEGSRDYGAEPTTLVAFELEQRRDGVMLTVTESGFDDLPQARRDPAFRANEQGWAKEMELVGKYVDQRH